MLWKRPWNHAGKATLCTKGCSGPKAGGEFAKNNSKPSLNCSQLHSLDAGLLVRDSYQLSDREL